MRKVPLCSSLRERHPCLCQVNISTQQYLLLTPFPCKWSWPHYVCVHTQPCPTLVIPWTVPHQAHLSMGFSRQEYWSGLSFPTPGDLPDPGTEPMALDVLHWQPDSLALRHPGGHITATAILFFKLRHKARWGLTRNLQNAFIGICGSDSKLERWSACSFLSTVALYDAYGNILGKLFNQINFTWRFY